MLSKNDSSIFENINNKESKIYVYSDKGLTLHFHIISKIVFLKIIKFWRFLI